MSYLYLSAREAMVSALARVRATDDESGERGQGMVEYGLILVLIAIVVIIVVASIGKKTSNVFSNVSNALK